MKRIALLLCLAALCVSATPRQSSAFLNPQDTCRFYLWLRYVFQADEPTKWAGAQPGDPPPNSIGESAPAAAGVVGKTWDVSE